jgi:hypothetical protein
LLPQHELGAHESAKQADWCRLRLRAPQFVERPRPVTSTPAGTSARRAGHAWGSRLAEIAIAEIATREAALRDIGADDDDVAAWVAAFSKQFIARMVSYIDRLHELS